jgi:hypothetical protein
METPPGETGGEEAADEAGAGSSSPDLRHGSEGAVLWREWGESYSYNYNKEEGNMRFGGGARWRSGGGGRVGWRWRCGGAGTGSARVSRIEEKRVGR